MINFDKCEIEKYNCALNIALNNAETYEEKIEILKDSQKNIIKKYYIEPVQESITSKILQGFEDCID
ncbi:MAG: hypothetical protein PHN56_04230 [Candidatus Nanoarchaeia archaeon]|nr:hypothetical protein [Candidatus Nanoarchaeia archaeon]